MLCIVKRVDQALILLLLTCAVAFFLFLSLTPAGVMACYTGPTLGFGQVGIGKNCSEMGVDKPLFSLMVSLPGLWISIVLLRLVSFGFGWIDVVAPARSCRWCGRALPRLAREEKSEFTEEHRDALLKPERIGMKCFRLLVREAAVRSRTPRLRFRSGTSQRCARSAVASSRFST